MPILIGPPSFYGKGVSFPRRLDPTGARPVIAEDERLVLESMDMIVNTRVGERPFIMRNGVPFGTRIRTILFEDVNVATDIIKYECKRALDLWEPRIVVDSVDASEADQSDGGSLIMAVVDFRFRSTNRSDNFVIPFRFTRPT